MEMTMHKVGASNLCYVGQSDMSHIGGGMSQGISDGSISENEESALYESTDQDNDASVVLSTDAQSATVTGYTYGLRSPGTVILEVSGHFQINSSLDSGGNVTEQSEKGEGVTK
eukprot:12487610-Ditylum_brightwellii.AAC.1